jgi:hypothetical protein
MANAITVVIISVTDERTSQKYGTVILTSFINSGRL